MVKVVSLLCALAIPHGADAYVVKTPTLKPTSPSPSVKAPALVADIQKGSVAAFAAFTVASSALTWSQPVDAVVIPLQSSSTMVSEKVIREGVYGEYEVDLPPQVYDDARSTFKSAKETKTKKVLIVGSFIIPMAQYFWYVRDDDSSDQFFNAKDIPEPPKKKGWF